MDEFHLAAWVSCILAQNFVTRCCIHTCACVRSLSLIHRFHRWHVHTRKKWELRLVLWFDEIVWIQPSHWLMSRSVIRSYKESIEIKLWPGQTRSLSVICTVCVCGCALVSGVLVDRIRYKLVMMSMQLVWLSLSLQCSSSQFRRILNLFRTTEDSLCSVQASPGVSLYYDPSQ